MGGNSDRLQAERQAFWEAFSKAVPELDFEVGLGWEKQIAIGSVDGLKLTLSLSQDRTSVYLVARTDAAKHWISTHIDELARGLRTVPGAAKGEASAGRWFRKDSKASFTIRRTWPEMIRWLRAQHTTYSRTIAGIAPP